MAELKAVGVGLIALAALVGGAAGAGASWALSRPSAAEQKKQHKAISPGNVHDEESDADPEALALRLDRLEGELRLLRKQNQSTDALRQYARVLKKSDAQDDAGAQSDGNEPAPAVDAEDPTFELAVRTVLDRVDWERQEERRVTQTKRREERAKRQSELLSERLQLSAPQSQKVQDILTRQMEAFRKLRDGETDGGRPATRSEWRARIESIRTDTEHQLGEVLDDAQMDSYRKFVDEEGFAGRGRGGGQRQQPSAGQVR